MAKNLTKCLELGKNVQYSSAVKEAATKGDQEAMAAALESQIQQLEQHQASIEAQVDSFLQERVGASVAGRLTSRKDTDPTNELNNFEPVGFTKLIKNLVQRTGSIANAVVQSALLKKNELTQPEIEVINDFLNSKFGEEVATAIDAILDPKNGNSWDSRHEDMMQFLLERTDGGFARAKSAKFQPLDPSIKDAIAASIYELLGSNSKILQGQTENSLKQLLGLDRKAPVPWTARQHLKDVGAHVPSLAQQLGSTILKRISIVPTKEAHHSAQQRMEMSLGLMAIAAMEEMGMVKREEIYTGKDDQNQYTGKGIEALKAYEDLDTTEVFYQPEYDKDGNLVNKKAGNPTMKTVKLLPGSLERVEQIETVFKKGRKTFDKLFNNESEQFEIRWSMPFLGEQVLKVGRTKHKVSELHAKNLKKYIQMPYEASSDTMALYRSLDDETIKQILGWETMDGKLDIRQKSVDSINRGIEREMEQVRAWLEMAAEREANNESTQFYILSKFQNNMRMFMMGEINPQNSKLHRNLFSPVGWKTSFSLSPGKAFSRKKGTELAFLEAVAFAFDIESGKVGGPKEQIRRLDELLHQPDKLEGKELQRHYDLVAAIAELRNYHKGKVKELNQEIIARGVAATGTKMHGFKGLNEYARYLNHQASTDASKGKFTTDLYKEIDGVSNGPIIGLMQLISDSADKQAVLATAAMGGVSIDPNTDKVNLDENLKNDFLHDAYQRMGQAWAEELLMMKNQLRVSNPDAFKKAMAVHRLVGDFVTQEGYIKDKVRKLSKPRTMQITYGAGIPRQTEMFAMADVVDTGIYGKLEDIMNGKSENPEQDLINLVEDINTLVGKTVVSLNDFKKGANFSKEKMREFKLERWHLKEIQKAIKPTDEGGQTYGDALKVAIETVYGDLIKTRKPFNDSVQYATTIYNLALHKRVTAVIESHKAANAAAEEANKGKVPIGMLLRDLLPYPQPEQLTIAEMDKITKDLEPLLPKIKIPLGSEQVLAKVTKRGPQYLADDTSKSAADKTKVNSSLVDQQYKKKGTPKLSGYVQGIPYLEPPGVSPMVKTIQMLDSMIANHLMGISTNILNNHDGFSHAIDRADIVGHESNKAFIKLITDFSLGQAFADAHTDTFDKRQEALADENISNEELLKAFVEDGLVDVELMGQILKLNEAQHGDWQTKLHQDIVKQAKALNKSYDRVLKDRILNKLTELGVDESVKKVHELVTDNVVDMGEQTTRNKKVVTDAWTQSAQYSNNGKGFVIPLEKRKNTSGKLVFTNKDGNVLQEVNASKVLTVDKKARKDFVPTMQELMDSVYGRDEMGSSEGYVDTDPSAYPDPEMINNQNVTQTFDTILNLDDQVPHARINVSDSHREYLRYVLDQVVAKVMTPIQLFKTQHNIQDETRGLYTVDKETGNKIWIQTQNLSTHPKPGMLTQGIRMSAAEVYAHEMVHHVTHTGLKMSNHLRRQVANLYELARDSFEDLHGANAFRVFMNNPNQDLSQADPYEVMAAKARWDYLFNPKQRGDKTHTGYDEFIAFGLTNENFRRELGKLHLDDKTITARKALTGIFQKDLQTTIVNIFNRIMDIIHQTWFKQQHSTRVDQELENLALALGQVDARSKTAVFKAFRAADEKTTALGIKVDEKVKDVAQTTWTKTQIGKYITEVKKIPAMDNLLSYQVRRALNWYNDSEQGLIPSIVTEMKGTTERLKPLHQLLNRRKHVIDHARNEVSATLKDVVNDWFERDLKEEEKVTITKGLLKPDFSSLLHEVSFGAMKDFLRDKAAREAKIKDILRQINADPDLKPYSHFFENAADDLGFWMVYSARRDGSMPFYNAHNIVKMNMTKFNDALTGHPSYETAVKLVDQLATLSALRYVAPAHKMGLLSLMEEFPSAMENVMNKHNAVKAQALEDNFGGSPHLMQKGYIKTILNPRIKYEQAHVANPMDPNDPTRVKYENMGYIMQDMPLKRDPNDPVQQDIYIFKSTLGSINDLQSGIASYRRHAAKGTTQFDIQLQSGNTLDPSRKASRNNRIMMQHTINTLDAMFKPRTTAPQMKPSTNFMVPKFNRKGEFIEMRYVMNEFTKDSMLQQFSEFDTVLAGMAADIVEKKYTPEINKDLVYALRDMYDHKDYGFKAQPEAFVEISPFSDNPRYRDIYHMLPPKAQETVFSLWGSHKMMVPRDVIDLAFGQRKYSIVEMFGKTAKERNLFESIMNEVLMFALGYPNPLSKSIGGSESAKRARVINRAKSIEDFMIQLTKLGKGNVIVRNIAVSRGNYASNMALLKSQGIPLHRISTLSQEAITSALLYQKQKSELEKLKAERPVIARKHSLPQTERDRLIKIIDRKILRYEDALARNLSAKLIESGLMPAVVDDVHTETSDNPFKFGLEAGIDTGLSKLPTKVEKLGRVLFMTEDTEGFKMLNNAVKMTDYVARYVLYRHVTDNKSMTHDDAVSYAMDKFINFDIPTHRTLQYLNDIGLVWYSKYQLRVLKHIKNTLKENPFTTMAVYLLGMAVGNNNILNSVPAITKDIGQGFGDPASVFADSVDQIFYADMVQSAAMYPFE